MDNVVVNKEHMQNDIEKVEVLNGEAEENKEIPKRDMRDCIYGKIDVSVETMDKVIAGLLIALVASIILGVMI